MSRYTLSAGSGQWLRATLREATDETVEDTLTAAMSYLGYHSPAIEWIDGGDVYAYASAEDAASDVDGRGPEPIVVATPEEVST